MRIEERWETSASMILHQEASSTAILWAPSTRSFNLFSPETTSGETVQHHALLAMSQLVQVNPSSTSCPQDVVIIRPRLRHRKSPFAGPALKLPAKCPCPSLPLNSSPNAPTSAPNCTLLPVLTSGEESHCSPSRIGMRLLPICRCSSPNIKHMHQHRGTEPVLQGQCKGGTEDVEEKP